MPARQHGRRTAGYTTARGYGQQHQVARRRALAAMQDGDPCSRCGRGMYRVQELHLDHTDDRGGYLGLSHKVCNLAAAARKVNRLRGQVTQPKRHNPSQRW